MQIRKKMVVQNNLMQTRTSQLNLRCEALSGWIRDVAVFVDHIYINRCKERNYVLGEEDIGSERTAKLRSNEAGIFLCRMQNDLSR